MLYNRWNLPNLDRVIILQYKSTTPLVFIHGSFASANSWRKIIERVGDEYECIAFDLPGHGRMDDPDDFAHPSLMPEFESIINATENKIGPQGGIHLVGHSYGGVVALAAAMQGVVPIRKLTLFEPVDAAVLPLFGEQKAMDTVLEFVDSYSSAAKKGENFACGRVIDFWGGDGSFDAIPKYIQEAMATMTKNNLRHWDLCKNENRNISDFEALNIPVTLVNGALSNNVAKTITSSLNRHLPNSKLETINGASHFMVTSHPDECAKIIKT